MPGPLTLRSTLKLWRAGMVGTSWLAVATTRPRASRNSTVSRKGLEAAGLRFVAKAVSEAPVESDRKAGTVTSTARSKPARVT